MENKTKTILDWAVCGVAVAVLVACGFFWGCSIDLWVTVLAGVIIVAGTVLVQLQNKKIKDLNA